jgi:NAD-dependent deacetylase
MDILETIVNKFKTDQRVVVFTGAGVSAESGIPTFRDKFDGLWSQYSVDDVASLQGFNNDPKLVWEWHEQLRNKILGVEPNPAHRAISLMEAMVPDFTLITQNIDGLHQRAGNTKVIELHGNIHRFRCFDEDLPIEKWADTKEIPPRCPHCGGPLRPDVVWFGEALSDDSYSKAKEAVRNCTMLFSIGTSSLIYPAAVIPFEAAHRGAMVVQINPNPTELDEATPFTLRGNAGEWMPIIVNAVWPESDRLREIP